MKNLQSSKKNFNQYNFALVPTGLNQKEQFSQKHTFNLSIVRGSQVFDYTKNPIRINNKPNNFSLILDRSHILNFFIPVFNEHRKIQFELKLSFDGGEGQNYKQIGSYSFETNNFISQYNSKQTKYYSLVLKMRQSLQLKFQLFIGRSRQQCQIDIREKYPNIFQKLKTLASEESLLSKAKAHSNIGENFNESKIKKYRRKSENYRETHGLRVNKISSFKNENNYECFKKLSSQYRQQSPDKQQIVQIQKILSQIRHQEEQIKKMQQISDRHQQITSLKSVEIGKPKIKKTNSFILIAQGKESNKGKKQHNQKQIYSKIIVVLLIIIFFLGFLYFQQKKTEKYPDFKKKHKKHHRK